MTNNNFSVSVDKGKTWVKGKGIEPIRPVFYILLEDKTPFPIPNEHAYEWLEWMRDNKTTIREHERATGVTIKTVFMGIDKRSLPGETERGEETDLFKTVLSGDTEELRKINNAFAKTDMLPLPYSTWKEAEESHKKIIDFLSNIN